MMILSIVGREQFTSNLTRRTHPVTHTAGFTLLELLVVIVIIGLLAAYVGPKS